MLLRSHYKVKAELLIIYFISSWNQAVTWSLTEHIFDIRSTSGTYVPENSLFTATINSGAFLCEFNESQTDSTRGDVTHL